MKLQCEVVQDLYPLYVEKELSTKVTDLVTEHLNECVNCRNIYNTGEGFHNNSLEIRMEQTPNNIKNNLLMKLKKRRITIVIFIFVIVLFNLILSSLMIKNGDLKKANKYIARSANRMALAKDTWNVKYKVFEINNVLCFVKDDKTPQLIGQLFAQHSKDSGDPHDEDYSVIGMRHGKEIYDDYISSKVGIYSLKNMIDEFNLTETSFNSDLSDSELNYMRKNFKDTELSLSIYLSDMASIMADRYKNKQWTEEDESQFNKLQSLLLNLIELLDKQWKELNTTASGPMTDKIYENINIKAVADYHLQINTLTETYVKKYGSSK